jgi:cold shock protein
VHTGKIKKLVKERGFGFISDNDGRELFFHSSGLIGATFESLRGDEQVSFEIETSEKGPRATKISVVQEAL